MSLRNEFNQPMHCVRVPVFVEYIIIIKGGIYFLEYNIFDLSFPYFRIRVNRTNKFDANEQIIGHT